MDVREKEKEESAKTISERLLDAAEHLFARQGIRGTSLREITEKAGSNVAAVNYYFRSKEALVEAVYERSFRPLNDERLRLLTRAETEAGGSPVTLESILRAFFEPMVRAWIKNQNFILLVGRRQHEPDSKLGGFIAELYGETVRRFLVAAKKALPEVPEEDLFFWLHFLFGGVVYTLLNRQEMDRLHAGENLLDLPEIFLNRLIVFGAAGLRGHWSLNLPIGPTPSIQD
jgi:AcrR family transcriptional regulator